MRAVVVPLVVRSIPPRYCRLVLRGQYYYVRGVTLNVVSGESGRFLYA
jgi:hypothetical protein